MTQATLLAVAQQAPPGSAVYDVGAHIGLYAALIDALYGHRLSVHAFEPTPDTARICEDIRRHNCLDFELITSAVSDAPGNAELHLSLKGESSNSLNAAHRKYTESVTVPVTTLDAFTQERSARPHLIKIDVETLEGQVLAGALETVRRHRLWIVLEILPGSDHVALGRALDVFTELGYGLHLIQPESPWPGRNRSDYLPHAGSQCRDWLLAPVPLTYDFHHAVRTWLRAILACDERTNLVVPGAASFPDAWNAPYTSSRPPRRRRFTDMLQPARQRATAGVLPAFAEAMIRRSMVTRMGRRPARPRAAGRR